MQINELQQQTKPESHQEWFPNFYILLQEKLGSFILGNNEYGKIESHL